MIDPSPYRSVAVASTFSPRFEQVLAEAKRIRDRFDSELCLVYVGEKSEETSAKFAAALERISLPKNSPIHYEQGDPATAILRAIERRYRPDRGGCARKRGSPSSFPGKRRS